MNVTIILPLSTFVSVVLFSSTVASPQDGALNAGDLSAKCYACSGCDTVTGDQNVVECSTHACFTGTDEKGGIVRGCGSSRVGSPTICLADKCNSKSKAELDDDVKKSSLICYSCSAASDNCAKVQDTTPLKRCSPDETMCRIIKKPGSSGPVVSLRQCFAPKGDTALGCTAEDLGSTCHCNTSECDAPESTKASAAPYQLLLSKSAIFLTIVLSFDMLTYS